MLGFSLISEMGPNLVVSEPSSLLCVIAISDTFISHIDHQLRAWCKTIATNLLYITSYNSFAPSL